MWLCVVMKVMCLTMAMLVSGLLGMMTMLVDPFGVSALTLLVSLSSLVVLVAVVISVLCGASWFLCITTVNLLVPWLRLEMLVLALKVTWTLVVRVTWTPCLAVLSCLWTPVLIIGAQWLALRPLWQVTAGDSAGIS